MNIEELVVIYKNEKSWISRRLSTIDNLLDRAAYGNSKDEEDLNKEYDELEDRMEELRKVGNLIDNVNELNRMICLIEDNIDGLACFDGNKTKIENLYKEIKELETKKEELLQEIAVKLKVDEKNKNNSNKR